MPGKLSLEAVQLDITPQIMLQNTSEMLLLGTDAMASPPTVLVLDTNSVTGALATDTPPQDCMMTALVTPWPACSEHSPGFF